MTATPTLAGALRGSLAVRVERETNARQRVELRQLAVELLAIITEPEAPEVAR